MTCKETRIKLATVQLNYRFRIQRRKGIHFKILTGIAIMQAICRQQSRVVIRSTPCPVSLGWDTSNL